MSKPVSAEELVCWDSGIQEAMDAGIRRCLEPGVGMTSFSRAYEPRANATEYMLQFSNGVKITLYGDISITVDEVHYSTNQRCKDVYKSEVAQEESTENGATVRTATIPEVSTPEVSPQEATEHLASAQERLDASGCIPNLTLPQAQQIISELKWENAELFGIFGDYDYATRSVDKCRDMFSALHTKIELMRPGADWLSPYNWRAPLSDAEQGARALAILRECHGAIGESDSSDDESLPVIIQRILIEQKEAIQYAETALEVEKHAYKELNERYIETHAQLVEITGWSKDVEKAIGMSPVQSIIEYKELLEKYVKINEYLYHARGRIRLARKALAEHCGYDAHILDDDIAPRIVEFASHLQDDSDYSF